MKTILIFVGVIFKALKAFTQPTESTFRHLVCQQCNSWCSTVQSILEVQPRTGKAGPRGPVGPRGSPGIVNLTMVEEMVDRKIEKAVGFLSIQSCRDIQPETAKVKRGNGGVFDIFIPAKLGRTEVFCDVETDGGGWIVFQRRIDGSVDFFREWEDYVNGFGNVSGEFWLGLEAIHQLTKNEDQELRIDMIEKGGVLIYAKYSSFKIEAASDKYRLKVNGYSGNATDSFANPSDSQHSQHNQQFSTNDRDNDRYSSVNCAIQHQGAWWYNWCHNSNLNGRYGLENWPGVVWKNQEANRLRFLTFTEMKLRPKK